MTLDTLLLAGLAAGLLLLAVMVAKLSPSKMGALTLAVLGLPLFVDLASGRPAFLNLVSNANEVQTGIHAAIALIFAGSLASLGRGHLRLLGGRLIVILLALYTISVIIGEAFGGAGRGGFMYYIQTITPLAAWFALAGSGLKPLKAQRAVLISVAVSLAAVVLASLLLTGSTLGSRALINKLSAVIPQYRNYFPYIVMCGVAFAVAGWRLHRRLSVGSTWAKLRGPTPRLVKNRAGNDLSSRRRRLFTRSS